MREAGPRMLVIVSSLVLATNGWAASPATQPLLGSTSALVLSAALGALLCAFAIRFWTKQSAAVPGVGPWHALQGLQEGVVATDADGNIEFLNAAAMELTGFDAATAVGQPLRVVYRIIDEHSRAPLDYVGREKSKQANTPIDAPRIAVRLVRRDGSELSVHDSFSVIRDDAGQCTGFAVVFHDISQLRALSQQLSWQASHDSLTGLVNRRELEHRMSQLLSSAQSQGKQHILLFIDLDNFKGSFSIL